METNKSKERAYGALIYAGAFAGLLLLGRGCTAATEASYDAQDAEQTATDFGFTNPEVTETNRWLVGLQGCGEEDSIGFEIAAKNSNGDDVNLLICKGPLKGATLRQR